jgi:hypothetical protein
MDLNVQIHKRSLRSVLRYSHKLRSARGITAIRDVFPRAL